ncbi:hypothetical protein PoB_002109700 [Plakobranchus ocellatus]|uniref:Uncharacterized protein n=1 Tax=Plakobranchus ocellatus TaxID=259542 RepID=A0AAV3ZGZ3_9GAST|nr:hypothetical protein PoB_002109700 [Plakobranchus ocellatus]
MYLLLVRRDRAKVCANFQPDTSVSESQLQLVDGLCNGEERLRGVIHLLTIETDDDDDDDVVLVVMVVGEAEKEAKEDENGSSTKRFQRVTETEVIIN